MVRTSSIIMRRMVEIVGRAPAEDEKVLCFIRSVSVCHALELQSL